MSTSLLNHAFGLTDQEYLKTNTNKVLAAMDTKLPIIVFGVTNVTEKLKRLRAAGVIVRPDLDKPEWGIKNMFEDGCSNLIMLDNLSARKQHEADGPARRR